MKWIITKREKVIPHVIVKESLPVSCPGLGNRQISQVSGQKLRDLDQHAMVAICITNRIPLMQNTHMCLHLAEHVNLHPILSFSLHITMQIVDLKRIWKYSWNLFMHQKVTGTFWRARVSRKWVICLFISWKRMIILLLLYLNTSGVDSNESRTWYDIDHIICYLLWLQHFITSLIFIK